MRYIVSGEFTEITETSGTIQNTSKINVVEVSDTNEKGSGIMLYPLEKFTFSNSLYARCVDGGGAEVRVVPFEVGAQGGGEQGTTPSGGGSGIAFAGMILGTESSTVDGGLWYEFEDGLPVVKMNYGGGDFLIDTHFDGDNVLIGDVLYLGGHRFQLTGFADDLTFSDNNFYAGGNSAPIGSVSSFAFQFTDEGALNVEDGGTISIVQLDNDTATYSLDLDSLNGEATPWVGGADAATNQQNGIYQYKTGTATLNYVKQQGSESYTYIANPTDATDKYVLEIQAGNYLTILTAKNITRTYKDGFSYEVGGLTDKLKVDEVYNNGTLTGFVVTILSDNTLHGYENNAPNNTTIGNDPRTPLTDWTSTVSAKCTKDGETEPDTNITVTVKLAENVAVDARNGSHTAAQLVYDENTKKYTYTTDTYVVGYTATSATATGGTAAIDLIDYPTVDNVKEKYSGDFCTIEGLAPDLKLERTGAYVYDIYKDAAYYATDDPEVMNGIKTVNNIKSGTKVGRIYFNNFIFTSSSAFDISDAIKNGTSTETFTVKLFDTQVKSEGVPQLTFGMTFNGDLAAANSNDVVKEGFTYEKGSYKYHTGKTGWGFYYISPGGSSPYDNNPYYRLEENICIPAQVVGVVGLDLELSGLTISDELVIESGNIKVSGSDTVIGQIDHTNKQISFRNIGASNAAVDAFVARPTLTIKGDNDYTFYTISHFSDGYTYTGSHADTNVSTYANSTNIDLSVDTYFVGYTISDDRKSATYHGEGITIKQIAGLLPPNGYKSYTAGNGHNATAVYWRLTENGDTSTDILFAEFNGQDWVLNSHAFDGVTTADTINITDYVGSTPINFDIELATDADTLAVSRTFANETFMAGATAGTYTYTATGTTAGWNISEDGTQIASWELNGKTFTIENLRTDLGTIGFDSQGYIHATNGSTIGRMGGNVIKLYDTAVHKLATPTLSGTDATDFTLILPS